MGTGQFLGKLKDLANDQIVPFGVDLAENMVEDARRKIPDLVAVVGDAAELDAYFPGQQFDCICTHFITGYVPMRVLGPKIASRLKAGRILVARRRDQGGLSGPAGQRGLEAPSLAQRRRVAKNG